MTMPPVSPGTEGQPPVWRAALLGLCPQCGARTLFAGVARFAPRCPSCGLDFAQYNVGDGPAAFLTLIIGTLVTIAALVVELQFTPPFWVHILLWVPITLLAVMGGLRFAKAMLLTLEHRRQAHEGQISDE